MDTLNIKSGLILLVVFLLLQILVRIMFRTIGFSLKHVNIPEDWLRFIRDSTAILTFIIYLFYSNNLDSTDFTISYAWMFFFIILVLSLLIIENLFLNKFTSSESELLDILKQYPISQIVNILLFAPIIEEIVCRKIILGDMNLGNIWIALIVSTCIFAILHFQFNFFDFILIFIYGLLLGFCYIKTESIINPIILHIFINAIQLLFIFNNEKSTV
ncbi:CPBP family intramembrane glutamic endopeptidase [Peribacillus sp. NPDC097675]|uniref:CPBP family intramembrane glutamic endopeptidase n=1 Tax=Peribacillus sp. NPDC097675 TaxID=3390618 RepID=UPI003D055A66